MAQSRRVLFVAGEVTPFAETSSIASLARTLPEQLQAAGDFEARVMMPCYGTIDEREHNLHEVIRLSGIDVPMGTTTETLTVKVASVPDVRLQVYFMDHDLYFGDNLSLDGESPSFEDLLRHALFFNRAALKTIQKLRWGPSLIHSFGWMSGFIPLLLASEYGGDESLGAAKSVFTPDDQDPGTTIPNDLAQKMGLSLDGSPPSTVSETGLRYADASIYPPGAAVIDGDLQFNDDDSERGPQLATLYNQMLNEVPA